MGTTLGGSNNLAVITGSGSVWSNSDDLYVGYSGSSNQLIITKGGAVYNNVGIIGYNPSGSNNTVVVARPGSVWNNSGTLYVGASSAEPVDHRQQRLGQRRRRDRGFRPRQQQQHGAGRRQRLGLEQYVRCLCRYYGEGNQLIITNGGMVYDYNGFLGVNSGSDNNKALVTGPVQSGVTTTICTVGYGAPVIS